MRPPVFIEKEVVATLIFVALCFAFTTYAIYKVSENSMGDLDRTHMEEVVTIPEGEHRAWMANLQLHGIRYRVKVLSGDEVDVALLDGNNVTTAKVVRDQLHTGVNEVDEVLQDAGHDDVWIVVDNSDRYGTVPNGPVEVRVSFDVVLGDYFRARVGVCASITFACIVLLGVGAVSWVRWRRRLETRAEHATIDIPTQRTRIIVDRSRAGEDPNWWIEGRYFGKHAQHAMLLTMFFMICVLFVTGIERFEGPLNKNVVRTFAIVTLVVLPTLMVINYYTAWRERGVYIHSYRSKQGLEIVHVSGTRLPEDLEDILGLVRASPHGPDEFDDLGALKVITEYPEGSGDLPTEYAGYRCPRCRARVRRGVMGQEFCPKCGWSRFFEVEDGQSDEATRPWRP